MSALNKKKIQIWRQYMNLSLHLLSLSSNCHYDHVYFSDRDLSNWIIFIIFIFQTEPMGFDHIQFWYMKREF